REPRVALAAAAATLAVLAGLVATTVQWRRAEAQSMRAEQAAAQARESLWQNRSAASSRLLGEGRTADAVPNLMRNLEEKTAAGAGRGRRDPGGPRRPGRNHGAVAPGGGAIDASRAGRGPGTRKPVAEPQRRQQPPARRRPHRRGVAEPVAQPGRADRGRRTR